MKALTLSQMESSRGGKKNTAGWICDIGAGIAGGSWAYFIGLASPLAGAICGFGWTLLSGWACDQVNDAYAEQEGGGGGR